MGTRKLHILLTGITTGPIPSSDTLIVANDWQYTIVNSPCTPEERPEGMLYVDRLWDTVTGSLAFFTPF